MGSGGNLGLRALRSCYLLWVLQHRGKLFSIVKDLCCLRTSLLCCHCAISLMQHILNAQSWPLQNSFLHYIVPHLEIANSVHGRVFKMCWNIHCSAPSMPRRPSQPGFMKQQHLFSSWYVSLSLGCKCWRLVSKQHLQGSPRSVSEMFTHPLKFKLNEELVQLVSQACIILVSITREHYSCIFTTAQDLPLGQETSRASALGFQVCLSLFQKRNPVN